MRVGIAGCGLNADYHISFARAYPGAEIAGIVDRDRGRLRECGSRFGIDRGFSGIAELAATVRPDVIHIVTPPATHFALASEALEAGCHVLVEKPVALDAKGGRELFRLAEKKGVMLCGMHNHLFDPCMARARALIDAGRAGRVVSVESHYGINTQIDAFRRYPEPDRLPWLYDMPGGVFHDFMPHPLYVMLPFLGEPEEVQVMEKSFGELPQGLSDELRVMVKGSRAFGMLTFSFATRPHHHFVRVFGTRMMLEVNFDTMTTTTHAVSSLPKAAQKAVSNLSASWQLARGTAENVWNFGTGRLRPYQGMKELIHRFYHAIETHGSPPVNEEDAMKVLEVMDRVWPRVQGKRLSFEVVKKTGAKAGQGEKGRVLVTGATGFLGAALVQRLCREGFEVRALARKLSRVDRLEKLPVEIVYGDVGSVESLEQAFEGVGMVVHAAADTSGREVESRRSTIAGTRNVLDLCRRNTVAKLVHISSCSVYGVGDIEEGATISEESPLERFPEKRGWYSWAKFEAEELVRAAMKAGDVAAVCLRPGTIYGAGGELFTPMMGLSLGEKAFLVFGDGSFVLPLVYRENLCDAIVAALRKDEGTGQVFNVVDEGGPTKRDYVDQLVRKLYPGARVAYFPLGLLYPAVRAQEKLTAKLGRPPILTEYRLNSSQKKVVYDSSKIASTLGWKQPFTFRQGIDAVLSFERGEPGRR